MNTIKFRLRDENKKIIGYEYFTQGEDLSGHWHYDFSMQGIKEWFQNFKWITKIRYRDMFMGMKDKNNVEIYAKDIIRIFKHRHSKDKLNVIVEWYTEDACFALFADDEIIHFMTHNLSDYEVMGDSYNNPELLKEKNDYNP